MWSNVLRMQRNSYETMLLHLFTTYFPLLLSLWPDTQLQGGPKKLSLPARSNCYWIIFAVNCFRRTRCSILSRIGILMRFLCSVSAWTAVVETRLESCAVGVRCWRRTDVQLIARDSGSRRVGVHRWRWPDALDHPSWGRWPGVWWTSVEVDVVGKRWNETLVNGRRWIWVRNSLSWLTVAPSGWSSVNVCADRTANSAAHRRRTGVSYCCFTHLEQSATLQHHLYRLSE